MRDFKIEGLGNISGGEFDTLHVEGVGNCSSNIKAKEIKIQGVFNCSGEIETDSLSCEGVANFKANIRAKKIYVEGVLSERRGTKIEAEQITCEGVIKTGGEISADVLNAEGCIDADEIVGDYIKILSHWHKNRLIMVLNKIRSKVRIIEATTIELSGVKAETVNGKDIKIGANCQIDNIDCSGILSIDPASFVGKITGEYTRRD
jgi:hypothetical protein